MLFGSAGVLAIDMGWRQVRLVHGSATGSYLKVNDFAVEELFTANPENVAQQLGALIQRGGLRSSSAALSLSGPEVVHRVFEFPRMPLNELGPVVAREMRILGVGDKEVVFDWEVVEEGQPGNLEQLRVLVAIAPKSQVDGALEVLRGCRLKPALLTTAPISILRSLKYIQGGGLGLTAALYLGKEQGYLLGLRDGAWSFLREFSSKSAEAGREGLLEEAAREASRALLYYGQQHREAEKVAFLLGGENGLEALKARLQRELGLDAEIVRPGGRVDMTPLRERAKTFRDAFPSFLIPVGLVAASAQPGINLTPKALRKVFIRRPTLDASFFQRPVWLVLIIALLVGVQWILASSESKYRALLAERVSLYAQWLPVAGAAEESRTLHENEKLLQASLGEARLAETSWVPLFKTVSRLVPTDLVVHSMSLRTEQGKWQVALKGEVVSLDLYSAQAAFNRFYRGLRSSSSLENLEVLPFHVSTLTDRVPASVKAVRAGSEEGGVEKSEAAGAEMKELKKTKLEFELRGYVSGR